jgi:adenine-specific DNA methyltransferase
MNYWFSEDKKIKLYNEDCLIVLQKLLDIGMKDKIDLIVCDPPYRVTSRGNAGNSGGMLQEKINRQGKVFKHNDLDCKDWFKLCYELLKDGGHCYIMCNHTNLQNYLNVAKDSGFHFIKSLTFKPVELMKILIENSSKEKELILDFACGVGSTLLACQELNRQGIGCEIDENYYNIAVKRLKDEPL